MFIKTKMINKLFVIFDSLMKQQGRIVVEWKPLGIDSSCLDLFDVKPITILNLPMIGYRF